MPATTLDPTSALVLIDLQNGVVGLPTAHPIEGVIANAARLASAFRARGLPVVLVRVKGAPAGRTDRDPRTTEIPDDFAQLVPELDQQPTDHVVTKFTAGAFTNTDLDEYLHGRYVTQIVLAGVSTSNGVDTTARQAFERGFHVSSATDAMTDGHAEVHDIVVTHTLPRVSETGSTDEILALLDALPA